MEDERYDVAQSKKVGLSKDSWSCRQFLIAVKNFFSLERKGTNTNVGIFKFCGIS